MGPAVLAASNNRSRQKKFMKTFSQLPQEEVVLQSESSRVGWCSVLWLVGWLVGWVGGCLGPWRSGETRVARSAKT